jgi:peptidoglycan/LPS O-acetylase OafA/YrhL
LLHPLWGFGFFVIVNCAVNWEREKTAIDISRVVRWSASIGLFSYSLYLTHELVIMQSWRFYVFHLPPILSTLLLAIPATVLFAWIFFRYCERPYLRKSSASKTQLSPKSDLAEEIFTKNISLAEEG